MKTLKLIITVLIGVQLMLFIYLVLFQQTTDFNSDPDSVGEVIKQLNFKVFSLITALLIICFTIAFSSYINHNKQLKSK